MFGEKAVELLRELKRSRDGSIPPYSEETIRQVIICICILIKTCIFIYLGCLLTTSWPKKSLLPPIIIDSITVFIRLAYSIIVNLIRHFQLINSI